MTFAYIVHPISGNVAGNLKAIREIAKDTYLNEIYVIPVVPYYIACTVLDDNDQRQREIGIDCNSSHLRAGYINELRVYGEELSPGMIAELSLATKVGIPIRPMTIEIENIFKTYHLRGATYLPLLI